MFQYIKNQIEDRVRCFLIVCSLANNLPVISLVEKPRVMNSRTSTSRGGRFH
jgi:hypothetical protein